MSVKRRVQEERQSVEKTETVSGEAMGYDFFLTKRPSYTEMSISPVGERSAIHLGLISFHPKNVQQLREFASISKELLTAIANELSSAGEDDLRSEWEQRTDKINASIRKQVGEMMKAGK